MIEIALAFLAGLLIGSFLNVCVFRLPRDLSVVTPARSLAEAWPLRYLAQPWVHGPLVCIVLFAAIFYFGPFSYISFLIALTMVYAIAALGLNIPARLVHCHHAIVNIPHRRLLIFYVHPLVDILSVKKNNRV